MVDIEQTGGRLPQLLADGMPVLALEKETAVRVDRDDRHRAGVVDELPPHCPAVAEVDLLRDNVPDHAVVKQLMLARGPGCDDVPELPGVRRGARRPCRAHSGVR